MGMPQTPKTNSESWEKPSPFIGVETGIIPALVQQADLLCYETVFLIPVIFENIYRGQQPFTIIF